MGAEQAFQDYSDMITTIELGDGLTQISAHAFSGCTAIEALTLPEGLKTIEKQAFYNCSSLKKITLPKSLKTIKAEILSGTVSLKELCYRSEAGNCFSITKDKKWNTGARKTSVTACSAA